MANDRPTGPEVSLRADAPRETFRRSSWIGFTASALLIVLLAAGAFAALNASIASNRAAFRAASDIARFGQFDAEVDRKMTALRNWIVTRDESALVTVATARGRLRELIAELEKRSSGIDLQRLRRIRIDEEAHEVATGEAVAARRAGEDDAAVRAVFRSTVEPRRVALERDMRVYVDAKNASLESLERSSAAANATALAGLGLVAAMALATTLILSVRVTRRLGALFQAERDARHRAETGEAERADLLRREREARARSEASEKRSAFLARASRNLSSTLQAEATLRAIADLVVPEICDWCIIDVGGGDPIRRAAVKHAGSDGGAFARRIEESHLLDPDAPMGPPEVFRSGVSELISDLNDDHLTTIARSSEALEVLRSMKVRSMISVAVRDAESVVGILTFLTSESGRRFEPEDLVLAEDLAGRAGIAMENARLFELVQQERALAEWHEKRSSFLARASEVLASSLDYRTTLGSVARLAVPEVADWCVIDMLEPDGQLRTIAIHHRDRAREDAARAMGRLYPWDPAQAYGPPHVMATGSPELAREVRDDMLRAVARDDEHYRMLTGLGLRSYMCVPLEVRGQVLGTITFLSADSGRQYEPDDLALAEALSYRASLAIDNARLYGEAQEAIRGRDDFLSIASHELKTPITTLQIQIQSFIRKVGAGPPSEMRELLVSRLQSSERQVERLNHLIGNLLDISRITGGRLDLSLEQVDFALVVHDVVARLEDTFTRGGIGLTVDAPDVQFGEWDRLRLDQIVTNLLSNALKYGAGRPVKVSLSGNEEIVRLEVLDHGIGIASENQTRIFERFERAVSGHHYGGLGLGLWIVRQIVDGLGGRITVQSEPGRGSLFAVELPRSRPHEQANADPGRAAGLAETV